MSISGALIGKIAVAAAGLALGGVGAFNMVNSGCVFGGCSEEKGAAVVNASSEEKAGGCCPATGGVEVVEVAASAGESCEVVCDGAKACAESECEDKTACTGPCDGSSAAVTEVAMAEDESCATACSAEKVASCGAEGAAVTEVAMSAEGESCESTCTGEKTVECDTPCEEKAECDKPCDGADAVVTEVGAGN